MTEVLKIALVLVFGLSIVQAQNEDGLIGDASRIALEPICNKCKVEIGAKKVIPKDDTSAIATDLDDTLLDYPVRFQPQKGPWYNKRDQSAPKDLVTWTFKVAAKEDAFICFGHFHVPRKVATTADTAACDASHDKVVVKDGAATTLLTCCGTQCHGKLYKLACQDTEQTYTVTLSLGDKDDYEDARWNDPSATLCDYTGIDIVDFQVSTCKTTTGDIQISKKLGYITLADANGGRTDFDSTTYEWRNYIDNDGTSNNADADACETACTAADKKCNFFIWATVSTNKRCYFGRFARDASSAFAGLETGAAIQTGIQSDGVVKLKKGALGDGIPAFRDHKDEEGLIAQFATAVPTTKDTSVSNETECAARCALGHKATKNEKCSGYKYNAETKECFYIDWDAVDLDNSDDNDLLYSPTKCVVTTRWEKNEVFAATPAAAPQQGACNTPTDGTAVITATTNLGITSSGTAGTCILKVVNNNVGKKVTLTLPASFGGAGNGGGILVYAGLGTATTIGDTDDRGVILYQNAMNPALSAETPIEWYAPVVTIVYDTGATAFTSVSGATITFES